MPLHVTAAPTVDELDVTVCRVPTDAPESDGTFVWDATTIVIVEAVTGDLRGLGYTYGPRAIGVLIRDLLAEVVVGRDPMNVPGLWDAMVHRLRNAGPTGPGAMAVAAVDAALWDLKAKLLDLPLSALLGQVRPGVPIYGSGGFTSYADDRLAEQLAGWVEGGIGQVKMKVGRDAKRDMHREDVARRAIGEAAGLFVDANGGYTRKEALAMAHTFAERFNVTWFEEPRPSEDLEGLRLLRNAGPPGMDIAAGEYGYRLIDFRQMLDAEAIDCLQADATRCGGVTGFLKVTALCEARQMSLSAHTAPGLHMAVCCAAAPVRHLEYFHDHVRLERLLFDGLPEPEGGMLTPDLTRPGHGLTLKPQDAEPYVI